MMDVHIVIHEKPMLIYYINIGFSIKPMLIYYINIGFSRKPMSTFIMHTLILL